MRESLRKECRCEQHRRVGGGLRAHGMLCHIHYDSMTFTIPDETVAVSTS